MKQMNTMMYVSNLIEQLVEYETEIKNADTFEHAKQVANQMRGYINGAHTVMNTMICMENNDFTGNMDDVLLHWESRCYGALGCKAADTKQDPDKVMKLLSMRDEIAALIDR